MCDTFVALADATVNGSVILAKNSDREPNEAHEVVHVPAAEHAPGAKVTCTYITIPQVGRTNAVLLGKPYWIWGAEMGANSHGVVIGNEAVFTKLPYEKEPGLIGMDLLRLGLERADTAEAAVTVMTDLLVEHGQGGNCGHTHNLRYHNSFLVADPDEAWILETAGREWAARRVDGVGSISNAITIGGQFDRSSPGLVERAVAAKWCSGPDDFDFAANYSDRIYTRFSDARARQCRTTDALSATRGRVDVAGAWQLLADHGVRADRDSAWGPSDHPVGGLIGATVCMHAGFGPVRGSQTTGSWIAELPAGGGLPATHWVTGTSAPCLSVRVPVWFDAVGAAGLPDRGPVPTGTFAGGSLWWTHEALHRTVLLDYARLRALIEPARRQVQDRIDKEAAAAVAGTVQDRIDCTRSAFAEAAEAYADWLRVVGSAAPTSVGRSPYHRAWRGFDKAAGRSPGVRAGAL
jgi:dipeptidase